MSVDVIDPIQSLQFDTGGNGLIYKLKALVACFWLLNSSSVFTKTTKLSHVSFLVGKGKE